VYGRGTPVGRVGVKPENWGRGVERVRDGRREETSID